MRKTLVLIAMIGLGLWLQAQGMAWGARPRKSEKCSAGRVIAPWQRNRWCLTLW